jgi:FkbM family methyltransferase
MMLLPKKYYELKKHYRRYGLEGLDLYRAIHSDKEQITFRANEYKHPVYLRNRTSDIQVFYQVLFKREYLLGQKFSPKVIIDLGSNIGLTSVFYKNIYPEATIIAVEADKGNYHVMSENLKDYENVYLYQKAIWNKSTLLSIEDNGLDHWGYEVKENNTSNKNVVESISMDQLIKNHNIELIDLLKIDIEGSEHELFENNYENWLPRVKTIVIELHDQMRANCSKSFFKAISGFNYKLSTFGENFLIKID